MHTIQKITDSYTLTQSAPVSTHTCTPPLRCKQGSLRVNGVETQGPWDWELHSVSEGGAKEKRDEGRRHENNTGGKWRVPGRQVEEQEVTQSKVQVPNSNSGVQWLKILKIQNAGEKVGSKQEEVDACSKRALSLPLSAPTHAPLIHHELLPFSSNPVEVWGFCLPSAKSNHKIFAFNCFDS